MLYFGKEQDFEYLAMTELGDNLQQLLQKCGGRFSLKSVIQIGLQLFERIATFHQTT